MGAAPGGACSRAGAQGSPAGLVFGLEACCPCPVPVVTGVIGCMTLWVNLDP